MAKVVTLGEIMLRLSTDPGIRIANAQTFNAHYGGGEANVAISLANFGHDVSFATKVPENPLGQAAIRHLKKYNVSCLNVLTGGSRLGTYYIESGVSVRADQVSYDRANSSFASMEKNEWSKHLFDHAAIFHISGITPALSKAWQDLTLELIQAARLAGCKISYDINFRGKLWDQASAGNFLKRVLPFVDYCSAGKLDAIHLLKITPCEEETNELPYYYQKMHAMFPNIEIFYSTIREIHSASENYLTGTLWIDNHYYQSKKHLLTPIIDRVGTGDAFSSGVLHGILQHDNPQAIINFGTAASALKHTVYGDCNPFTETEIKQVLAANSGKINR